MGEENHFAQSVADLNQLARFRIDVGDLDVPRNRMDELPRRAVAQINGIDKIIRIDDFMELSVQRKRVDRIKVWRVQALDDVLVVQELFPGPERPFIQHLDAGIGLMEQLPGRFRDLLFADHIGKRIVHGRKHEQAQAKNDRVGRDQSEQKASGRHMPSPFHRVHRHFTSCHSGILNILAVDRLNPPCSKAAESGLIDDAGLPLREGLLECVF
ncbi:hypothetical protein [Paenibacillus sp. FSL M7-1455]|uniref:hypothetical protein n=1 Tax=Paenibacillus sp. FSL M7-1455 TaxID=2975316 RepID=UPI004040C460